MESKACSIESGNRDRGTGSSPGFALAGPLVRVYAAVGVYNPGGRPQT